MTKAIGLLASVTLLAGLAVTQPVRAQGGCPGVNFTGPVASQFPEARDACLEMVTRNGQQFAHFKGEIVGVSGNQVRAHFKLPNGQYSPTYAFTPQSGARVNINGTKYRFNELSRGQDLDIYLPPDRWEFDVPETENFAAAPAAEVVRITTITRASPTLPKTASSVPLVGLLSVALLALGAGLTFIKRRVS
jgi:LPXTG-motif cell wall-anchored protein